MIAPTAHCADRNQAPVLSVTNSNMIQELALSGQATQGGFLRGQARKAVRNITIDGKPVAIATDGRFLLAFDRDAPAVSQILVTYADGAMVTGSLAIAPRSWQIEHIDAARQPEGITDPEYAKLRSEELAKINAARAINPASNGWKQAFIWPVQGRLSGHFGAQRVYRGVAGAYHSGTDIAGISGTPIVAPADGVVVLAADRPFSLEGNLLIIDHGMGLSSAMLHCSALVVKLGDVVRQGQVVARVGMTGRATGPHLHWSLRWKEARLDAELLAPTMPIALKNSTIVAPTHP
ncbi:MAG: hypothetical protein RLY97_1296 [Pseudomonadota bacterium]